MFEVQIYIIRLVSLILEPFHKQINSSVSKKNAFTLPKLMGLLGTWIFLPNSCSFLFFYYLLHNEIMCLVSHYGTDKF